MLLSFSHLLWDFRTLRENRRFSCVKLAKILTHILDILMIQRKNIFKNCFFDKFECCFWFFMSFWTFLFENFNLFFIKVESNESRVGKTDIWGGKGMWRFLKVSCLMWRFREDCHMLVPHETFHGPVSINVTKADLLFVTLVSTYLI
jgi:hypothetical protein